MRDSLLSFLRCPNCKKPEFQLEKKDENRVELAEGSILCKNCSSSYEIENGIVHFLKDPSVSIIRERKAMDEEKYIKDEKGVGYKITDETIDKFRQKFLSLPEGDGSYLFKRGGSFQSIRDASERFYKTLEALSVTGREMVLEIGAGFSWASHKFAAKGCKVVASDISNYLKVSCVYLDDAYFERIFSDMHNLPFRDGTFDIVFGSAVLHHTKKLRYVFSEIHRILKQGGRFVLINESARGIFEKVHPDLAGLEKRGYQDTAYTIPQWQKAAKEGGFKKHGMVFLSIAGDYITRHRDIGSNPKLKLAHFIKNRPRLEKVLLALLKYPRILFRPKSWKMICYKY